MRSFYKDLTEDQCKLVDELNNNFDILAEEFINDATNRFIYKMNHELNEKQKNLLDQIKVLFPNPPYEIKLVVN